MNSVLEDVHNLFLFVLKSTSTLIFEIHIFLLTLWLGIFKGTIPIWRLFWKKTWLFYVIGLKGHYMLFVLLAKQECLKNTLLFPLFRQGFWFCFLHVVKIATGWIKIGLSIPNMIANTQCWAVSDYGKSQWLVACCSPVSPGTWPRPSSWELLGSSCAPCSLIPFLKTTEAPGQCLFEVDMDLGSSSLFPSTLVRAALAFFGAIQGEPWELLCFRFPNRVTPVWQVLVPWWVLCGK